MEISTYVFGVATVIAGIFAGMFFSTGHRDPGIWASCLATLCVVIGAFCWYQGVMWERDKRITDSSTQPHSETAGFLKPGSGEVPAVKGLPDDVVIPETAVIIFLGSAVAWTSTFPYPIFMQRSESMLEVGRENSAIWVSGKFFSNDGKIICELVRNQFHLNQNNYFRRELTDHTLTIFDNEARKVITIDFVNPRTIKILGDFYFRHGTRIRLEENEIQFGDFNFAGQLISGDNAGGAFNID